MARHGLRWGLAALLLCWASLAFGEDKDKGRELFELAGAEFVQGNYGNAQRLYADSYTAYPAPTALFWQARALDKLDRLLEARDAYRRAATWSLSPDDPPAFGSTVAQAKLALVEIERAVPAIVVTVDDPAARVTIDGTPLAAERIGQRTEVDPGPHVILVEGDGYKPVRREVVAERGRTADVSVAVTETGETVVAVGPSPLLVAGVVVGGFGTLSLVVWGVTGALYLDREATVDEHCDADPRPDGAVACDAEGLDAAGEGKTLGIVNTVALFTGIAAVGVGAALIVLGLTSEEAAPDGSAWRVVPYGSPEHAGIVWTGRF